ncbi:MAG: amidohydrolase family protein [Chitinophagales bacterium]|nr:amidohydrolase family protein [Chitinophagales bacterium]
MKKLIFTLFMIIGFSSLLSAQIPEHIKKELVGLTEKIDQLGSPVSIEKEIMGFVSNAPDEGMKKSALNFIYNKSKSVDVKAVVESLLGTKFTETDNSSYIVLKSATIIDMIMDEGRQGDILIKDESIERISYDGSIEIPKGAVAYDLSGKYIIPGLIDSHVHITHGTLKEAQEHLEIALKNGVTGVRDMGGDGRMLTLLKKNMQIGENIGPDVFFSTIIAGPSFFLNDPRPQQVAKGATAGQVPWQRSITSETDLRQIITEVIGMGATAIKIYASVDKDLMKKVANEAKRQGLKVWGHAAIPPVRPSEVSNAGVEVMSHAGDMVQYELVKTLKDRHDFETPASRMAYRQKINSIEWNADTPRVKELFETMEANDNILDATLWVYTFGLEESANKPRIDSSRYKNALKATKTAFDMGVKIGAGSDDMISQDEYGIQTINIHNELSLLVKAGLPTIDALKAATIVNAEGLGEEKNIGSIEKGKLANLVVLNNNPLEDIQKTSDIRLVLKRGKVIH